MEDKETKDFDASNNPLPYQMAQWVLEDDHSFSNPPAMLRHINTTNIESGFSPQVSPRDAMRRKITKTLPSIPAGFIASAPPQFPIPATFSRLHRPDLRFGPNPIVFPYQHLQPHLRQRKELFPPALTNPPPKILTRNHYPDNPVPPLQRGFEQRPHDYLASGFQEVQFHRLRTPKPIFTSPSMQLQQNLSQQPPRIKQEVNLQKRKSFKEVEIYRPPMLRNQETSIQNRAQDDHSESGDSKQIQTKEHEFPLFTQTLKASKKEELSLLEIGDEIPQERQRLGFQNPVKRVDLITNRLKVTIMGEIEIFAYNIGTVPELPKSARTSYVFSFIGSQSAMFHDCLPLYDQQRTLYTFKEIAGVENGPFDVNTPNGRCIQISVDLIGKMRIRPDHNISTPSYKFLSAVVNRNLEGSFIKIGRSYAVLDNLRPLNAVKKVSLGFTQELKVCNQGIQLEVDLSASIVFSEQNLASLYTTLTRNYRQTPEEFQKLVMNLKVETTHTGKVKKYRIMSVATTNPSQTFFEKRCRKGSSVVRKVTVAQHFLEEFNIKLKKSNLPVVVVGVSGDESYLPMELCFVSQGQPAKMRIFKDESATMFRMANVSPESRLMSTKKRVSEAGHDLKAACGVRVDPEMIRVKGIVLNPPLIQYKNDVVKPSNGEWTMQSQEKCFEDARVQSWGIINLAPGEFRTSRHSCDIPNFKAKLTEVGTNIGVTFANDPFVVKDLNDPDELKEFLKTQSEIVFTASEVQFKGKPLYLVILRDQNTDYMKVKKYGNSVFGVFTQCIKASNAKSTKTIVFKNLCKKINAKLNAKNHVVTVDEDLGQDVTELIVMAGFLSPPGPDLPIRVASVAANLGKYNESLCVPIMRFQRYGKEIQHLAGMVCKLLKIRIRETDNKTLPRSVLFYRHMPIKSKFVEEVFTTEVKAIHDGCAMVQQGYRPKVTYIGLVMNHSTRLYLSEEDTNERKTSDVGNVEAGTVVDYAITGKDSKEFYLASQMPKQGTTVPPLYRVHYDENQFPIEFLEKITYMLTHTIPTCTNTCATPAPAHYAKLVTSRAKDSLNLIQDQQTRKILEDKMADIPDHVQKLLETHENLEGSMFFI